MSQQIASSTIYMDSPNLDPLNSISAGNVVALDIQGAIQAARLGDDRAFSHLVEQYQSTAQRVAQHILRTEEAAADAVQEALIKAHRAMPRFQEGNFRSWLLRIVTNTCYDHLRRQRRRAASSLDELVDDIGLELPAENDDAAADPARLAIRREGMDIILQEIDQLPAWHRNVVLLIDVHGYDYAETAELLDLPLGTVKSRLSRARAALRDALAAHDMVPANLVN